MQFMSRSAFFSTIETALSHIVVARLILEECELLIGSEYGVVLRAIPAETRSFEPISVPSLSFSEQLVDEAVMSQASTALQAQQSIEVCGTGFGKIALLRSLARQAEFREFYPHGILYIDQSDTSDDLLQIIFEQFYRVPSDVKPSRAEIRSGLSDRQALILLDHPTLISSELNQLKQFLPNATFAIASIEARFFQADCTIGISDPKVDLGVVSVQKDAVLGLLATVGVSLKAEQISAITNVPSSELNRLIDLNLIQVEQERYKFWTNYQISEAWMEKVLSYVLDWVRTQPDDLIQERELIMVAVQWSANQRRSLEVIEIVRSIERVFAIAKLWGSWSKLLRWSLAAA